MGFFGDLVDEMKQPHREKLMVQAGVGYSSGGYERCENCSLRLEEAGGQYLGCAKHKITVYANTVCRHFSGGPQKYKVK